MNQQPRREFLAQSAVTASALWAASMHVATAGVPEKKPLRVGVMGLSRGMAHVNSLIKQPNVELKYLCEVDESRLNAGLKNVEQTAIEKQTPKGVGDYRKMLDDKEMDAIFIAAPNHWHAPATIQGCLAGKHVYVEKPGSQNPHESEVMVATAAKTNRIVQMGNQRRTWPAVQKGIARLKEGVIGRVLYARCWYDANRPTIKKGNLGTPPATLDYTLWQGPAPERPYKDNLIPYNWHWHWHWGNGELGNNGIHALDVARWGLGVDIPNRVSFVGGRYHFDDDQETPDTGVAIYHFGDKGCTWEDSSCHPRKADKNDFVAFYGDEGSLHIQGAGYIAYDKLGKEIEKETGAGGEDDHIANFLSCIRDGQLSNSNVAECQKSTMLCHLGNISYRVGRTLDIDTKTSRILNDNDAMKLWQREYRPGFELPKI